MAALLSTGPSRVAKFEGDLIPLKGAMLVLECLKKTHFSLSIYFTHNVWEFLHLEQESVKADLNLNCYHAKYKYKLFLYSLNLIQVNQTYD